LHSQTNPIKKTAIQKRRELGVNKEKGDGKVSVVVEVGSWKLSWKTLNLYTSVSPHYLNFLSEQFILIRSHLFVIHIMLSTTILDLFPFPCHPFFL